MKPAIGSVVLCALLACVSCDTEARERQDNRTSPAPTDTDRERADQNQRTGTQPDGTGTTGRGTSGTEGTRPSETPDTQRGAEGTLSDQTTIGTKTVAEWRALPREQFAMEMSTYLTTLDERLQSADESVRTELTRKRDDLKKSLTDLRATTSTTWEDTRRKVLEGIREIETRLERR